MPRRKTATDSASLHKSSKAVITDQAGSETTQDTTESRGDAPINDYEIHCFSGIAVWANTRRQVKAGKNLVYTIELLVSDETLAEMESVGIDVDRIKRNDNKAYFQRFNETPPRIAIATPQGDKTFDGFFAPGSKLTVKLSLKNIGRDKPFVTFVSLRVDELVQTALTEPVW